MVNAEIETFCVVSRVLTGVVGINARLAAIYLARLKADVEAAKQLQAFLTASKAVLSAPIEKREEEARSRLVDAPVLAQLTRRIIVLWYTGKLLDGAMNLTDPRSPEEYFGALMWDVMGAHAPGLSGGYFGYWRYPPEN